MIIATPPGGRAFYSNDGQLFCDGDVTIYSPASLPVDTVLTSNRLGVRIVITKTDCQARVIDEDSEKVLWQKSGLKMDEAFDLAQDAAEQFRAAA